MELIFRSIDEGLGLSLFVSLGNQANLGFANLLDYLKNDPKTSVIAMFIEGVGDARKLMNVAKKVSEEKVVLAYKGGKTEKTAQTALSHTGAIAGSYKLYEAAFKQAGILEVSEISELMDAAKALLMLPKPKGCKAAILTHTAGPGIITAEILEGYGARLAEVSEKTKSAIRSILPVPVSAENPVDILGLGWSNVDLYGQALELLAQDEGVDAIIAIYTPVPSPKSPFRAPWRQIVEARKKTKKPIVASIVSPLGKAPKEKDKIESYGIPVYPSIERAAKALANYLKYWQRKMPSTF